MKLKQCLRMAVVCSVLTLAWSCQKTIPTVENDNTDLSTIPRSPKDAVTHYTGYGYDATGAYAHSNSVKSRVINVASLRASLEGSYYEDRIDFQYPKEEFAENAVEYSRKLSNKTSVTAGLSLFGGSIGTSYTAVNSQLNTYDGKHIYADYTLTVHKSRYRLNATINELRQHLSPEFVRHLNEMNPQQLVNAYGTHVMVDFYAGGRLNLMYQSESRSTTRSAASRAGIKASANFIFDLEVETANSVNTRDSEHNFNSYLSYYTLGGNASQGLRRGTINLSQPNPKISTAAWQNSITRANADLVDFSYNGLIPITDLIMDNTKRQQVQRYILLTYIRSRTTKMEHYRAPVYSLYYTGSNGAPLYRYDHKLSLTTSVPDYLPHGVKFYAYSYPAPNTVPLHEYYSLQFVNHLYTTKPEEDDLRGYVYRGISFYVHQSRTTVGGSSSVPVYGFYNPHTIHHFYGMTTVVPPGGYYSQGIAFYAHNQ